MARTLVAASTQYYNKTGGIVAPCTFALWVNLASVGAWMTFIGESTSVATETGPEILFYEPGDLVWAGVQGAGGVVSAIALSASSWYHLAATFDVSQVVTGYINGANSFSNTGNAFGSVALAYIGYQGAIGAMNGTFAFPAIWNVVLSAADIAILAKGASPRRYHPAGLVSYSLMSEVSLPASEVDLISRTLWTKVSTPAQAVNPRIYPP